MIEIDWIVKTKRKRELNLSKRSKIDWNKKDSTVCSCSMELPLVSPKTTTTMEGECFDD